MYVEIFLAGALISYFLPIPTIVGAILVLFFKYRKEGWTPSEIRKLTRDVTIDNIRKRVIQILEGSKQQDSQGTSV